jgi:hypothetical protein
MLEGGGGPPKGALSSLPAVAALVADLATVIAAGDALPAVAVPGVGAVIALAAGSCLAVLCVGC